MTFWHHVADFGIAAVTVFAIAILVYIMLEMW